MKFNIGFIPTLLLLIPVIFACFKTPADKPELEDENIIVFIAKCVGRFGCIGYMCLAIGDYEVGFSSKLLFLIWAVVALLVIALYWVLWIRHYKKGNHFEDIYGTGIPAFHYPCGIRACNRYLLNEFYAYHILSAGYRLRILLCIRCKKASAPCKGRGKLRRD